MAYARASDGIRLHYDVHGRHSAPVVLMIQGLGADKHGWDMQRIPLALHYRVIALDNRGDGDIGFPLIVGIGHGAILSSAADSGFLSGTLTGRRA